MSKTVLTVDDSESVRDMVSFTLENEGYNVVTAKDGQDGLDQAMKINAHMVITDLNMPIMDGIGFIKALRQKPSYTGVPIIILTTESQPEKKEEGKAAGAMGWIVKPFDAQKLIQVVKKVIG